MIRGSERGISAGLRAAHARWGWVLLVCMLGAGCPSADAPPPAAPTSHAPTGHTPTGAPEGTGETVADGRTDASPAASATTDAPSEAAGGEVTLVETTPESFAELLASKKGKIVLVDFWATWCIPCRKNFPHIVEFQKQYAEQGLEVISVSLDDAEARGDALEFLKEQGARFDNLISTLGLDSFEAFNITGGSIPHYRLYARDGTLAKSFETDPTAEQPITAASIESELRKMLEAR